jgi:hypothetical protein
MESKTCRACGVVKPKSDYYAQGACCKICKCARARELHAQRTPESLQNRRNTQRAYRERTKERIAELSAIRRKTEKHKEWTKEYREKNKEKLYWLNRNYYLRNKEEVDAKKKVWYKNNSEKTFEYYKKQREKPGVLEAMRERSRRQTKIMGDSYIKHLIARRSIIDPNNVPVELIETKRLHLKLSRAIKENA